MTLLSCAVGCRPRSRPDRRRPVSVIALDGRWDPVEVPDEILEMLRAIVHHVKAGHGVSVVALQAELTTVEAAGLLNVSRAHLVKRVEAGAIPYRMVGTHRRRLLDVSPTGTVRTNRRAARSTNSPNKPRTSVSTTDSPARCRPASPSSTQTSSTPSRSPTYCLLLTMASRRMIRVH